jgi:hypothetical protein
MHPVDSRLDFGGYTCMGVIEYAEILIGVCRSNSGRPSVEEIDKFLNMAIMMCV